MRLITAGGTGLRLNCREIGDADAQAVAELLRVSSTLQTLELHANSISDTGAQALADALRVSSSLVTLSLSHNEIGAAGAQARKKCPKTHP